MTKEKFEEWYCGRSMITLEEYHKYFVTLSCKCGEDGCNGWAVVPNRPSSIKAHYDIYN